MQDKHFRWLLLLAAVGSLVFFMLTGCREKPSKYRKPLTAGDTVLNTYSFTYDMWGDGGSSSGYGGWSYRDCGMRADRFIIDSMLDNHGHPEWYTISSHVMQPLKGHIKMSNEASGGEEAEATKQYREKIQQMQQ